MSDAELLAMLVTVVEANTKAMEKNAAASDKMAEQVKGLRTVITATQRKIGGEIGPLIERQKKTVEKLDQEVARARADGAGNAP